ncbi:MAG: hypothetical protein WD380_10175, partial [Gaiellaceae bacterium]
MRRLGSAPGCTDLAIAWGACPLGSLAAPAGLGRAGRRSSVIVSGCAFDATAVDRGTVGTTTDDVERSADTAASAFTSPTSATSVLAS